MPVTNKIISTTTVHKCIGSFPQDVIPTPVKHGWQLLKDFDLIFWNFSRFRSRIFVKIKLYGFLGVRGRSWDQNPNHVLVEKYLKRFSQIDGIFLN
jgi:hypothetical protein